jgi:hypothetical protein
MWGAYPAAKRRKNAAHGASRGKGEEETKPAPKGRKKVLLALRNAQRRFIEFVVVDRVESVEVPGA